MRSALILIAIASTSLLYAMSTPVGGSPDEDAHMVYAWGLISGQGVGEPDVPCDDSGDPCPAWAVEVPANFAPDNRCYIAKVQVEAACGGQFAETLRPTSAYRYPPPYYLVVGAGLRVADWLGAEGQTVGFVGRFASIALSLSLLVPAFRYARGPVLAAAQVAMTPMAFFMIGSINPSGIEISAAIAAAVSIVRLVDGEDLKSRGPQILLAVSISWLAWARPLSALWAAALALTALVFVARSFRMSELTAALRQYRLVWITSFIAIASAGLWLIANLDFYTGGSTERRVTLPEPGMESAAAVLFRWGGLVWENLGVLGWLDTRPPILVMLATWAAIVIVAGERIGHHDPDRRKRLVVGGFVVLSILLVTSAMWAQEFLWQGRYVLPLFAAMLVLLAGSASPTQNVSTTLGTRLWALCVVFTAGWLYARHSFGLQPGVRHYVPDLSGEAQWWGPLGVAAYATLALLVIVLLLAFAHRSPKPQLGANVER